MMRMQTLAVVAVVLTAAAGPGAQGTASKGSAPGAGPDKATIEKTLVANENAANAAVAKGDSAGFFAIVAADAWSLEAAGPMPSADLVKNLAQIKIEPGWKISDTKVLWVNATTAVLTYKWTGKGTFAGQPFPSPVWASTTYTARNGKWVAVFHQETPAAPPGK